jgi:hypothetical protein
MFSSVVHGWLQMHLRLAARASTYCKERQNALVNHHCGLFAFVKVCLKEFVDGMKLKFRNFFPSIVGALCA